jgi:hypothetical protein
MDPAQSAVVAALGAYQMQFGNVYEAINFWNQALAINPTMLLIRTNLAAALAHPQHEEITDPTLAHGQLVQDTPCQDAWKFDA